MAKISFTKLNKIKSIEPKAIMIGEQQIEIRQYLPIEDKLNLLGDIVYQAGNGEEGFFNLVKLEVFYTVAMIQAYTNISFTDKQLEDIPKLYDALRLNDVWAAVYDAIPAEETEYMWDNLLSLAREMTQYHNSALGILRQLTENQNDLDFNLEHLFDKISDPEQLQLVKRLLEQTGPVQSI